MSQTIHLPLIDRITVASPCSARWEDMAGDARVRHCAECNLDVHNISAMTRGEAEVVLQGLAKGRVCARFFRRADGTILTRDCPAGLAAARRRVLLATSRVAAALGLAVLAGAAAQAAQDKSWGNWGWSMRLANVRPVGWVLEKVRGLAPARGRGLQLLGDIALPPHPSPPAGNQGTYQFGPHEWEYRQ